MDSSTGIVLIAILLIAAYVVYLKIIKGMDEEYPEKQKNPPKEEPRKTGLKSKERRFLIIWVGICAFAFLVNIADIRGRLNPDYSKTISNLWTTNNSEEDFWPFTTFTKYYSFAQPKAGVRDYGYGLTYDQLDTFEGTHFYGIFNSFNELEFLVYIILGLAIVFIPKIW